MEVAGTGEVVVGIPTGDVGGSLQQTAAVGAESCDGDVGEEGSGEGGQDVAMTVIPAVPV